MLRDYGAPLILANAFYCNGIFSGSTARLDEFALHPPLVPSVMQANQSQLRRACQSNAWRSPVVFPQTDD